MGSYDLIDVTVNGATVQARPVAWSGDLDNLTPIRYQTTCPHCAQLIEFSTNEMSENIVRCGSCGAPGQTRAESPQQQEDARVTIANKPQKQCSCIIDPITAGTFPMEDIDVDFLKKCGT